MDTIEHKKGKIYYSMGEVAEMFDVNATLIRFWESKFDILKPHKNKKGNRLFTPQDVDNLKLIYHLVKEKGMTLAGAQKRLKQNPGGLSRDMEVVERLHKIRALLVEIREELKSDGSEVYHEDELDAENTMAEVKPAGKVRAGKPRTEKEAAASRQAEEEWVGNELAKLNSLDKDIAELAAEEGISRMEADQLLEEKGQLPLAEEPQDADNSLFAETLPESQDDTPAAFSPGTHEQEAVSAIEITETEFEMLDDESEDYPEGEVEDERPPFEVQSLFSDEEIPVVQQRQEEEAVKPRIVEQTLF